MSTRASRLLSALILFLSLLSSQSAEAWVETAVRGHEARIEVAEDGQAIVRHRLILKVRGGPMKFLEIGGMGTSIEPLPEASVRRAVEGSQSRWPLTVSSLEDGSVRLGIGAERGIRGGSYAFSFAYSLDLNEMGWIAAVDGGTQLTWVGPRLSSGVDSAKVTFVLPRGTEAPVLAPPESGAGASVLLGEIRRGAEFDEIELVRAHLAQGEPALWRVLAAPGTLNQGPVAAVSDSLPALGAGGAAHSRFARASTLQWALVASSLALFFALLTFWKAKGVLRAAQMTEARDKPLIPATPPLRAGVAGAALGGAVWFALQQQPWIAVVLACLSLAMTTFLLPVRIVHPRGPGEWQQVSDKASVEKARLPGTWFETRNLRGFFLFLSIAGAIVICAYRILPSSNYLALMTIGLVALLVPLFWTGRARDFPRGPIEQAMPWFRYLGRAIDPQVAQVELWGRRAAVPGAHGHETYYDEARLRFVLPEAPAGLRALEVSLDEAAGACVLPCVVLRVLAESPTAERLPRSIKWQRGRSADERVAILRPSAPTRAQLLRLVRSLLSTLRGLQREVSKRPARSSGNRDRASNAGTPLAAPAM